MKPEGESSSLGDRLVRQSNKNLKTAASHLFTLLLKRTDIDLSDKTKFTWTNRALEMKQKLYASSVQEKPEGSRKRMNYTEEDGVKRDQWLCEKPILETDHPEDLLLRVGSFLLDTFAARGPAFLTRMRRSYIKPKIDPNTKREYVEVQLPVEKTNKKQTYVEKIQGKYEVETFKKLLAVLPLPGCKDCSKADPPRQMSESKNCVCNEVFLTPKKAIYWRPTDVLWFTRQKWSRERIESISEVVSKKAGLANAYSNSSSRPDVVTHLHKGGATPEEIMSVTRHTDNKSMEGYKRLTDPKNKDHGFVLAMLHSASGRQQLRTQGKQYGELPDVSKSDIYENFKAIREGREPATNKSNGSRPEAEEPRAGLRAGAAGTGTGPADQRVGAVELKPDLGAGAEWPRSGLAGPSRDFSGLG
jgi:hypothetical protein